MAEQYFNNFQTTVGVSGYTSGSGVLDVVSTTGITLASGDKARLTIYRVITGVPTVIVILIVTAVNSGTQFAVTAEGTDASALAADIVIQALTAGAMDQIRVDKTNVFTGSLPTDSRSGDIRIPTDDITMWLDAGSGLVPYGSTMRMVAPIPGNFAWTNQGGATNTNRAGSVFLQGTNQSGDNIRFWGTAVPGSTPYSFTVGFDASIAGGTGQTLGFGFYDGTKYEAILINLGSGGCPTMLVIQFNNATSFHSAPVQTSYFASDKIFFKVRNDGTNIYFYCGTNPFDLVLFYQEAVGNWLSTITQAGFVLDGNGSGTGFKNTLTVFHIEVGA